MELISAEHPWSIQRESLACIRAAHFLAGLGNMRSSLNFEVVSAAADGNVFATLQTFVDPSGNILGRMFHPPLFYPVVSDELQNPVLNDSGSLYYWAHPEYIDIVDVQHGTSKLRFSLSETVKNTVSPMAIDSGGQHIYLITTKGLTIVDSGEAPLSIGHLSQTSAVQGAAIMLRGSGFESGISMTVGGLAAVVTYTDANTLTFTVPPVDAGVNDITLKNPDGTSYTLENALSIQ